MSFKNIIPEEYERLVKNKNRIFDMTFKTPERLNKYRDDKYIYEEIKYSEKQNKKLKDYDKISHENLDKYFIENADKKKIEEVSTYNYNIIRKKEKELEDKNNEIEDKNEKIKDLRSVYIRNEYGNKYDLNNNINILKSFETVFNEYDISYNPYKKSKETKARYLLDKLKYDTRVDRKLFDYFYNTLKEEKKLSLRITTKNIFAHRGKDY